MAWRTRSQARFAGPSPALTSPSTTSFRRKPAPADIHYGRAPRADRSICTFETAATDDVARPPIHTCTAAPLTFPRKLRGDVHLTRPSTENETDRSDEIAISSWWLRSGPSAVADSDELSCPTE